MLANWLRLAKLSLLSRGGSRAAALPKMERFAIIVNGWKLLTIITKRSILDAAAALDLPLLRKSFNSNRLKCLEILNAVEVGNVNS